VYNKVSCEHDRLVAFFIQYTYKMVDEHYTAAYVHFHDVYQVFLGQQQSGYLNNTVKPFYNAGQWADAATALTNYYKPPQNALEVLFGLSGGDSTQTITYNANGGSVSPSSASVTAGTATTLPTPTRSGYTCTGWFTATSGGTKIGNAGASYTPTASVTLYAQ